MIEELSSHMYAIRDPAQKRVKVGIAENVPTRFMQLQASSAGPLKIYWHTHTRCADKRHEDFVHVLLHSEYTHSEWFRFTEKTRAVLHAIRQQPLHQALHALGFRPNAQNWLIDGVLVDVKEARAKMLQDRRAAMDQLMRAGYRRGFRS